MEDDVQKTDEQLHQEYNIYEPDSSGSDDTHDPETQGQPDDKVNEPDGDPDNQAADKADQSDQASPDDNSDTPDGGGDKLEITDDATYVVDGDEISGKELQGRMLLKSRYDELVRQHNEDVVKPNEGALQFVQDLTTGLESDPVNTLTKLSANIASDYNVDFGNILHNILQVAHQSGQLSGVTLFDEDDGDYYEPVPPQQPLEDPRFQQQLQTMEQRTFMAEMRADRTETMNLPEIKKAGVEMSDVLQHRADQLYGLYRSNPAFSPDPERSNQYSLALVTAWNEMVMRGAVQPDNTAPPQKPNLLNNNKSSKKRVSPTVPDESVDPQDRLYRKYGIYK